MRTVVIRATDPAHARKKVTKERTPVDLLAKLL